MKQAMIFAAGLGTRLRPLTDTMPKALVRVGEKPLLWHVVTKLKQAGFERIVVNVHHFAGQITDYLEANQHFGLDIRVSDERQRLLNTGGGIRKACPLFCTDQPVLIHNVDILSNLDLDALYAQVQQTGKTTLVVSRRQTSRYFLFDSEMELAGWVNTTQGKEELRMRKSEAGADTSLNRLAFSGIHVLTPQALDLMAAWPERFGIVDFYLQETAIPIVGHEQTDLRLLDVGKTETLAQAATFVSQLETGR